MILIKNLSPHQEILPQKTKNLNENTYIHLSPMTPHPLLKVKNLCIEFRDFHRNDRWKLHNVNFCIKPNETVGIVGESGSGKSVTALSILRLLNRYQLSQFSGKIIFNEKNLLDISESEILKIRGREISMIFQDPMSSLNPTHTILKQVSENIRNISQKSKSLQNNVNQTINILEKVGLKNPKNFLQRFPHELSGGERQRVMIAMAIINQPRLLIADEPTTALDATVQNKIIELLQKLKKSLNLSLLFVTHDLTLITKIADYILVMKDGQLVEQGSTHAITHNPKSSYTQKLFNNIPTPLPQRSYLGEVALQVKNLNVVYPHKSPFLKRVIRETIGVKDISFTLTSGRTLGVIGESGSGKSTLLMAILRLLKSQGEIIYRKKHVNELPKTELKELRRSIQVVFQDSFSSLNPRLTVEKIIGEGLEIHFPNTSLQNRKTKIEEVMTEVGLPHSICNRYPHEFSGGQRQRINIARALVLKPDLVLLDEPTSSLDVTLQKQVLDFLLKLQEKKGLSYIFISHDLRVIQAISDWVIVMKKGVIVESGIKEDIFHKSQNAYTQSLIAAYK